MRAAGIEQDWRDLRFTADTEVTVYLDFLSCLSQSNVRAKVACCNLFNQVEYLDLGAFGEFLLFLEDRPALVRVRDRLTR